MAAWFILTENCLDCCGWLIGKMTAANAEMQFFHEIQQFRTDAGSDK